MHINTGAPPQTAGHAPSLQGGVAARLHPKSLRTGRLAQKRSTLARAAAAEDDGCVVGIDLGTTNSAVVVVEGGELVVVPSAEGGATTPSVVAFQEGGAVLVGEAALRQAASNPANTFYSVKRFIGRTLEEAEEDAGRVTYAVAGDEDGFAVLESPALAAAAAAGASSSGGGEGPQGLPGQLYPEEVSGYVVAKLLAAAEAHAGRPVRRAVISVPAYFDDTQREATVTAGRIAGLDKVRILREPVAAALAYGLSAEEDQTVLVLDLGGGTYDVSLLEVGGGVIEVLSTGGDPHLGGDDWDDAIVRWLEDAHLRPAGVDCEDERVRAKVRGVAEAAKKKLSEAESVVIRIPAGGGIEATLTRQMFEGLTLDLFRRARTPLDQACWQAGVDLGTVVKDYEDAVRNAKRGSSGGGGRGGAKNAAAVDAAAAGVQIRPKRRLPVSAVLLVGGATRMPAVQRFVRNMTGLDPKEYVVDPDLAVAMGAAVQAGIYEGAVSDLMVMDVWQASLMRAFATQLEKGEAGSGSDDSEEAADGGEEGSEEEQDMYGEMISDEEG